MVDNIEKGFVSGCDDYVKKPIELKELDIRINNIKRLFNILPNEIMEISQNIYLDRLNLFIKINDKTYAEVLKGEEIVNCLHCGRILYKGEEETDVTEA